VDAPPGQVIGGAGARHSTPDDHTSAERGVVMGLMLPSAVPGRNGREVDAWVRGGETAGRGSSAEHAKPVSRDARTSLGLGKTSVGEGLTPIDRFGSRLVGPVDRHAAPCSADSVP
jgi:hypothetical protein